MTNIQIITDSASDIPGELAVKLGIQIVPIYVRFGEHVYRDGIEMTSREFYSRLLTSPEHPATSQPTPEDFASFYNRSLSEGKAVISIHISSRISGTFNSALTAKRMASERAQIEVIDSTYNSAGTMLAVLEATHQVNSGASFDAVVEKTKEAINQIQMLGVFSTMKYLARSGRVNRSVAKAADFLNVMPLLTFHNGEIARAGLVRTINKGIERLTKFVKDKPVKELIIVHSAIPETAQKLYRDISQYVSVEKSTITELGAALGVHGGPGVLLVALRLNE